ncbi:DUF3040 domain-containing protein [Actinoplanes sp. TRM 88003]|uniref:DUF3040 domain-containing protein n=1 Tax=Paractinoplanes aksuensis TaxID=2939490 RepID=A0ABT1E3E8_9ACTN|nr:DUF3040 domain-containing protein [Actinoplanes aksuensis]MCO8277649.1 DUF3040 domain-containing protein [Actinoplanes aksuensis]
MDAERRNAQFDEIVTKLVADDPSFETATRTPLAWDALARVLLLVVAALGWAGLSVLMVVWGWRGVLVTVPIVVAGFVVAVRLTRNGGASQAGDRTT